MYLWTLFYEKNKNKNKSLICSHHHLVGFCFMGLKSTMANTHTVFIIANKYFRIWELLANHLNKFLHVAFDEGSIHVKAISGIQDDSFHLRVGGRPLNHFTSHYYEISLICSHFLRGWRKEVLNIKSEYSVRKTTWRNRLKATARC